jgi:hypothetical protein
MHRISGSTPEADAGARSAAVACYLAPAPLKYLGARGQTGFALQHRRQALALSFLAVCFVGVCAVAFLVNTWLNLNWERTAFAQRGGEILAGLLIVLALAWATAWVAGIVTAARASSRALPVLARLGALRWVRRTGLIGASGLWLIAAVLAGLAIYASRVARPLDSHAAPLYILYDDTQAPRWVMALVSVPTIYAAEQHWGRGSTIVAPISPESLAEGLARGRFVYVAVHGEQGPLLYRGGEIMPRDVAGKMPVGAELRLVYLSACHSGDLAADWEAALAPAKVISFPRFSAYLEHAWFLWIEAPRAIARRASPFDF